MTSSCGPLDEVLQAAAEIAAEAAELVRAGQQRAEVRFKGEVDLVTDIDTAAEALIVERLQRRFPGARLICEEGSAGSAGGEARPTWYVDPLDGTTNFAHGFPQYAVSLGLVEGGALQVGVVADVPRAELYLAARGQGAWVVGADGVRRPLRVSATAALGRALLATGFPYDRHTSAEINLPEFEAFLRRVQGIRRAGAAALDLAFVARGWFDGYWEMKLKSWDMAAGALLVQEAGGRVSAYDGGPLLLDGRQVVASNGLLHEELLAVLRQVRGGRSPLPDGQ